jgi:predicted amidohydrolase YtcJ
MTLRQCDFELRSGSVGKLVAALSEHDEIVDASQQTVMPGLWESHTHHLGEGKVYGDRLGRLWLAYGVTTLQSYLAACPLPSDNNLITKAGL